MLNAKCLWTDLQFTFKQTFLLNNHHDLLWKHVARCKWTQTCVSVCTLMMLTSRKRNDSLFSTLAMYDSKQHSESTSTTGKQQRTQNMFVKWRGEKKNKKRNKSNKCINVLSLLAHIVSSAINSTSNSLLSFRFCQQALILCIL